MAGFRLERVGELLKEVISESLAELKDPRVGFVSITSVVVSPDLRHAKVYVSVYGQEADKTSSLIALNNAKGFIRRRITPLLSLRHIPQLHFVLDDSIEYGVKMAQLIAEANKSSQSGGDGAEEADV